MRAQYFSGNTYITPANKRRAWGDRFLLGSRWWFHYKFLRIVFNCSSLAKKGLYDDEAWAKSSMDVFEIIERSGGRFHIEGFDNLRQEKDPVIIISNHMSTLETIIFPVLIAPIRKVTFIVKDNLVKDRVFGPIMRSRNPIVVGRTNSRRDLETVFRRGPELISDGYSIIVFPQSTRYEDFDPAKFNSLGVKLAKKTGVRVVPAAIKTDFWAIGKYLKDIGPIRRKRPIHIHFGPPMAITGNGRDQHQQIIAFIQAKLEEWQKK